MDKNGDQTSEKVEDAVTFDRISVNPKVHFGKPCVAGTRITVVNVLELVERGIPFAEIVGTYYPDLTADDLHACIRYAIAMVSAEDIHLSSMPA